MFPSFIHDEFTKASEFRATSRSKLLKFLVMYKFFGHACFYITGKGDFISVFPIQEFQSNSVRFLFGQFNSLCFFSRLLCHIILYLRGTMEKVTLLIIYQVHFHGKDMNRCHQTMKVFLSTLMFLSMKNLHKCQYLLMCHWYLPMTHQQIM